MLDNDVAPNRLMMLIESGNPTNNGMYNEGQMKIKSATEKILLQRQLINGLVRNPCIYETRSLLISWFKSFPLELEPYLKYMNHRTYALSHRMSYMCF